MKGGATMFLKILGTLICVFLMIVSISAILAVDVRTDIKVTELKANSGLAYEVAKDLQVNDKEYTDREYLFTSMPDYLLGLTWIRTANNDKQNAALEISFKIDKDAYIYILWIARDPAQQEWFQKDYEKIDGEVGSTDESLSVYKSKNTFSAGEIKTYQANTGAGMYVIALEAVPKLAVEHLNKVAVTWGKLKRSQ
jgi:hypothetical protein